MIFHKRLVKKIRVWEVALKGEKFSFLELET